MRKQVLLLSLTAIAGLATAQTTITSADQPAMMQVFMQANDTTGTQVAGPGGASQTWNFSGLLTQTLDSVTWTNPAWTPYDTNYTGDNVCIVQNLGDVYIYGNLSASSLQIVGTATDPFGNGYLPLVLQNPETQMIYPAAYGSSFGDTATGLNQFYLGYDPGIGFPIDSVLIHTTITKDADFDAWGSITTPFGTFNTLRQNTYRKQVDTIDIYVFGMWNNAALVQVDSARLFSFWTNGCGMPILDLNDQDDIGQIHDATWIPATPAVTGIPVNTENNPTIIFPNPVGDVLTVQTSVSEGTIELVDMTGRVVKTQVINSNTTRINVSDLSAGMYLYNVNGVATGKVQVAH